MRALSELAPWRTYSLGESPFPGYWPFNPSVVRTPDGRWLCSIRLANYHLPGSTAQPARADLGPIQNRILLMELDPATWTAKRVVEIVNPFAKSGVWNSALGFEDLRLVWTDGGLHATASAMRIDTGLLEIVVLEIEDDHIVEAHPLRGPWSSAHQKNFSNYAEAPSFRTLYSVLGGGIHDRTGRIVPTRTPTPIQSASVPRGARGAPAKHFPNGSMEVQIRTAGRVRNADVPAPAPVRLALRGGTQLVRIGADRWLGLAHGCQVGFLKFYYHQWYTVDFDGNLLELSEPMKLSPRHGIEFAAGLARDPATNELVVSFGIEDDSSWLGITRLAPVLETLAPAAP